MELTKKRKVSALSENAYEELKQGNSDKALSIYEEIVGIDNKCIAAWHYQAVIHSQLGEFKKALQCVDSALSHYHWSADLYNTKSGILLTLGRFSEALEQINRVLHLNPNNPAAFNNRGMILMELDKYEEAIPSFEKAVCLSPYAAHYRFNYALGLLKKGDYINGFKQYEWRHSIFDSKYQGSFLNLLTPGYNEPLTLLHEQGYGDTIQFCRYIKLLSPSIKKLIMLCPPALEKLLSQFPGIDEFNVEAEGPVIPMLNLPKIFDTTLGDIPFGEGYLKAPTPKPELANLDGKFKIGIVWGSRRDVSADFVINETPEAISVIPSVRNLLHFSSHKRSVHPRMFDDIAHIPGVKLYSLQKGSDKKQLEEFDLPIVDLDPRIDNFADTASVIDQLDLVISIDTAVAHLAGALGKPTLILLPYSSEWRWGRENITPWYKSVRLLRQTKYGEWDDVFTAAYRFVAGQIGLSRGSCQC